MNNKTVILASVLTLCLCVPPAHAGGNAGADFLVKMGKRSLEKGDEKDAIHEFSKALLLDPGHSEAHRYLVQLGCPGGLYPKGQGVQTKEMIADRQITAAGWYGDVQVEYPEFEAWRRQQNARKTFRSERILYENDKDRASYLREYPQLGQGGMRHVSDSLAQTTVASDTYAEQMPPPRRKMTPREILIERTLDAHDRYVPTVNDQIRFPNPMIQDPGPASRPVETQTDFYDLQGMIDFSRENETAFFYWLDDEPKELYEIQFTKQDELIAVLDEYLRVREAQIESHKDKLLGTELELLQTEQDLAAQVEANNDLHEVYRQVVRLGDDQAYYIVQENNYMQFLEGKLESVRSELSDRTQQVEAQETQLARLEQELAEYRRQVDDLLTEREDLLTDVSGRVDELQRIGDLNVRK